MATDLGNIKTIFFSKNKLKYNVNLFSEFLRPAKAYVTTLSTCICLSVCTLTLFIRLRLNLINIDLHTYLDYIGKQNMTKSVPIYVVILLCGGEIKQIESFNLSKCMTLAFSIQEVFVHL